MRRLARGFMVFLLAVAPAAARDALPPGFVYLRDIDASIAQDMRYATSNNFTDRPLPGYAAPECILRRDMAQALARVQADLASVGLGLKVYDCYRPTRAVAAMARWASAAGDESTKRFYPKLDKRNLFSLGYIAAHSAHSTGTAVDLTLIRRDGTPPTPFDSHARYGACTAPASERAPDDSIDMGTGFDCFDPKSFTANGTISAEQRHWRDVLLAAMHKQGLKNYFREWWHFTDGPQPPHGYDFVIAPH
jgi:D-alanyl-D-alanine dipeptidase